MVSSCNLNFYDLNLNFFSKNKEFISLLNEALCFYKGFNKNITLLNENRKKDNFNEYEVEIIENKVEGRFTNFQKLKRTHKIQNLVDGVNILYKEESDSDADLTAVNFQAKNDLVSNRIIVAFEEKVEEIIEKHPYNPKINFAHLTIWSLLSLILMKMDIFLIHSSSFCGGKGNGVLIVGKENSGKTTILKHFINLGCEFISDDITIVRGGKYPEILWTPPKTEDFNNVNRRDVAKVTKIFFPEVKKESETEFLEMKGFDGLKKFISYPPRFIEKKEDLVNFFDFSTKIAQYCKFYKIISGRNLKKLNEIIFE